MSFLCPLRISTEHSKNVDYPDILLDLNRIFREDTARISEEDVPTYYFVDILFIPSIDVLFIPSKDVRLIPDRDNLFTSFLNIYITFEMNITRICFQVLIWKLSIDFKKIIP